MQLLKRIMLNIAAGIVYLGLTGCVESSPNDLSDHNNVEFDISPTGEKIVFSSADGDLFLLNLETSKIEQLIASSSIETDPSFSPDGEHVIYASYAEGSNTAHIFRTHLNIKQVVQLTFKQNVCDLAPKYSSDGSLLVFARAYRFRSYSMGGMVWDDWDVCVSDKSGKNLQRVTNQKYRRVSSPGLIPHDNRIIFAANWQGPNSKAFSTVYEVSVAGSAKPKLITKPNGRTANAGVLGDDPSISSNGKWIVFISDQDKSYTYDIYVKKIGGTELRSLNVRSISNRNKSPVYSPDGESIYFLAEIGNFKDSRPVYELWKTNKDGKNSSRIASKELFDAPLIWAENKNLSSAE